MITFPFPFLWMQLKTLSGGSACKWYINEKIPEIEKFFDRFNSSLCFEFSYVIISKFQSFPCIVDVVSKIKYVQDAWWWRSVRSCAAGCANTPLCCAAAGTMRDECGEFLLFTSPSSMSLACLICSRVFSSLAPTVRSSLWVAHAVICTSEIVLWYD
jgi:hypothetical protein